MKTGAMSMNVLHNAITGQLGLDAPKLVVEVKEVEIGFVGMKRRT